MTTDQLVERLLDLALEEDVATGDLTTNAIIPARSRARDTLTAHAPAVARVAGQLKTAKTLESQNPARKQHPAGPGKRVTLICR